MSDIGNSLGGWSGTDFHTTVSLSRGVGSDTDAPDNARFLRGVAHLVRQRQAEAERRCEEDESDLAIFILHGSPGGAVEAAESVPMLNNGLTPLTGRLWFTAAAVVSGHCVDLPPSNDSERLSYVTDTLKYGSEPTVVFDARTSVPQLRWYPEGLQDPDTVEVKAIDGEVTCEDVFDAISVLHKKCLITPTGLPQGVNLWNNASQRWVRRDAEALLQSLLKVGLMFRFPYCTIRHEQPQMTGRTDLEIEYIDPIDHSIVTRYAILELKVLRSFGSTGGSVSPSRTNEHINDGVEQANAYRIDKEARWSALCCFDMRECDSGDESCFEFVKEFAARVSVTLRRWYLYASSEEYQQALAG